jgi:hypothetical protein
MEERRILCEDCIKRYGWLFKTQEIAKLALEKSDYDTVVSQMYTYGDYLSDAQERDCITPETFRRGMEIVSKVRKSSEERKFGEVEDGLRELSDFTAKLVLKEITEKCIG